MDKRWKSLQSLLRQKLPQEKNSINAKLSLCLILKLSWIWRALALWKVLLLKMISTQCIRQWMLETVIEDEIQKASTEFSKVKQDYSEK